MMTKKKTILAAALVVAIVALAGVGYATFTANTYQGDTTSTSSKYDVDWVTVSLGDYGTNTSIYLAYNTTTNSQSTSFTWLGSSAVQDTVTIKTPAAISTQLQGDTRDNESFTLKAVVASTPDSPYKLQYKDGEGAWTDFSTTANGNIGKDGITLTITLGTDLVKTISWRIVPTSITTDAEGPIAVQEITVSNAAAYVDLPAIQYVVTAAPAA